MRAWPFALLSWLFLSQFAAQAGLLASVPVLPDVARDLGVSVATRGPGPDGVGPRRRRRRPHPGRGEWHAVEVPRSESAVPGRQEREVVRLLGGSFAKRHGPPYGNPPFGGGAQVGESATFTDRAGCSRSACSASTSDGY